MREPVEAAPIAIDEPERGLQSVERRDGLYRRLLAGADSLALLAGLVMLAIAFGIQLRWATLLAFPLIVVGGKLYGLYDRDELLIRKTTVDEAPKLFQLATLATLVLWVAEGSLLQSPFGQRAAVALWATLFLAFVLLRRLARVAASRATDEERCLFIGDATSYGRLEAKIEGSHVKSKLVGRMNLQRASRAGARAAREDDLRSLIEWTNAQRVIIESQALPGEEMLDLVRTAKSLGVQVSLVPKVLDVVGTEVVFDDLQGMTLLGVRRLRLSRSSLLVKRAFDLAASGVILLAVSPLLAVIALAIKLDSRGPIFFRQTRVGRGGRHFRIFKFRTMIPDAEDRKADLQQLNEAQGGLFKIAEDPRITRVGRLLRKTSLDELPQLFNVISGAMSLVGPRPLVVDEDAQITGWDRRRLQLTPGMTGHWQIAGSSRVPLAEMVKIDYLYVGGWSLWADLKILVRTVPYVLARRGM